MFQLINFHTQFPVIKSYSYYSVRQKDGYTADSVRLMFVWWRRGPGTAARSWHCHCQAVSSSDWIFASGRRQWSKLSHCPYINIFLEMNYHNYNLYAILKHQLHPYLQVEMVPSENFKEHVCDAYIGRPRPQACEKK